MTKDTVAHRSGTRADHARWSFRPLRALVALLLGMVALLASEAPAEAGQGHFKYLVIGGTEYTGSGQLNATQGVAACSPGFTSYRQGGVTSEPVELPPLVFGNGSLEIRQQGTAGVIEAEIPNVFSFDALHTMVVECVNGVPSASEATPCAAQREVDARVYADISGGTGDKLTIKWRVNALGSGGPVPDFTCAVPFQFPRAKLGCKSRAKLGQFTKKRFTLDFECHGTDEDGGVTPPDVYQADSDAFGRLSLCRKARGGTDQVCATRKQSN